MQTEDYIVDDMVLTLVLMGSVFGSLVFAGVLVVVQGGFGTLRTLESDTANKVCMRRHELSSCAELARGCGA